MNRCHWAFIHQSSDKLYIDYVLLIIIELKPHKWIRFEFNTAAQQIRNENDRSQNDVVIAGNCVFDLLLDCCLHLYASWLDGCQFFFGISVSIAFYLAMIRFL